ncbi:glycoside hydrolase family 71 protein [Aspergillus ibericus CBS 121593]|uniref:Alpha-1,3-glucanase/mutanase n=1 Tax=Aspergillus ibericus CBS 121593 TaxID=1448316 RepID=A0A395HIF2_9EURO|nr:alpha-1,3-glucanase/mutanase [Aspergillus ibericus CBS 121593]RAL06034.1 alpha-1,3-glucanase/mutanase [Aspergillus ibericus CBS 121593]
MRRFLSAILSLSLCALQVQSRAVFAHFMVSNTLGYTVDDWQDEMLLALDAKIDAFAMNIAVGDTTNTQSLENAFSAAVNTGFSLFFSFDYAGNGAWAKDDVLTMLNTWMSAKAYWRYNEKPFVSTFEGPDNADDWIDIKEQTGCFFIPDWSSVGADVAVTLGSGVADGLFSWAAWPYGPSDMNTYVDASYIDFLDGKPYMMPVSPWFFTNMPGYSKNWLWRGDDLWYDRWVQALYLAPEFIEIISWNDFGESHYIGPIQDSGSALAGSTYTAFGTGQSPYNYALDMPHDGWRAFLPWLIDTYKNNISTITQEGVQAWYRLNVRGSCASDGGTTGNTVSQLQLEYWPYEIPRDRVFFSALLSFPADISVTVGGTDLGAKWNSTPSGGAGIYHGSVDFATQVGSVEVAITRDGATIASFTGQDIVIGCAASSNIENWNAWVGSAMSPTTVSATPTYSLADEDMGPQPKMPKSLGVMGYPAAGMTADYSGLCAFSCNYGYCPSSACTTTKVPLATSTISPFTPNTCTAGEGTGDLAGLCSYGCNYGFCPIHNCTCTTTGPLNVPPTANTSIYGFTLDAYTDSGLCDFACERNYCPSPVCLEDVRGSGDGGGSSCTDDETGDDCLGNVTTCDYTLTFASFASLSSSLDTLEDFCVNYYALDILADMLNATMTNYTDILSSYSGKFTEYQKYIREEVPGVLTAYMNPGGAGNAFFTCTFGQDGVNTSTTTCPFDVEQLYNGYDIYYDLTNATAFWANLTATTGIQEDWVQFGDKDVGSSCGVGSGKTCQPDQGVLVGYPLPADTITVTNPQTIIEDALPGIQNLTDTILLTQILAVTGAYGGSMSDVLLTISTVVFTLAQAVANMGMVVEVADKASEEEKKAMIEEIIFGVLMIAPFLGEIRLISESLEQLADMMSLIGDAGALGSTIYGVATDPDSAILDIFEIALMGGVRTPEEFEDAANARRALTDDEISSLGSDWKSWSDELAEVRSPCY